MDVLEVLSCNALSNKVCVPNKTEDSDLSMFNMIAGISESETLTKHVSYKCECKFDGRKCHSNQKMNNDKYSYKCRKHHICEKIYIFGILLHVVAKMVNISQVLLTIQ